MTGVLEDGWQMAEGAGKWVGELHGLALGVSSKAGTSGHKHF